MKKILLLIFISITIKAGFIADAPVTNYDDYEEYHRNTLRRKRLTEFVNSDFSSLPEEEEEISSSYHPPKKQRIDPSQSLDSSDQAPRLLILATKPSISTCYQSKNSNHDERKYRAQCTTCGKKFKSFEKRNIKKSIDSHRQKCIPNQEIITYDPSVVFSFFTSCPHCETYRKYEETFLDHKRIAIERLAKHIQSNHLKNRKPNAQDAKKYITITEIMK